MTRRITVEIGKSRPQTTKELHGFNLMTGRIELGLCPNGCGPLRVVDQHNEECAECGFHYGHNGKREQV